MLCAKACPGAKAKALWPALALAFAAAPMPASAETISGALAKAYSNNPQLNVQRANTRVVDENIPRATAGYRPTITASGDAGLQQNEAWRPQTGFVPGTSTTSNTMPRGYGLTVQQNIWNGNRTLNSVRQAESQVMLSREQLRSVEGIVLANGAIAYMNVLRDTAILNLRNNNVRVLEQQLKQTQDRFQVGEVTRTDVAQAEAALAVGRSDAFVAQSNLQNSIAVYRQVIGAQPKSLSPARPLDRMMPKARNSAIQNALRTHPDIVAALHNADAASLAVKVSEGALMPTVNLQGNVSQRFDLQNVAGTRARTASIVGSLSIPLYDGGLATATIRQAKEQYGAARLQVELQREAVRAAVVSNWGQWENSARVIAAQQAAVRAAEIALAGIREEARVGQRTTFDVLNAQQQLLIARVNLVTAQRDRVVSSYTVLQATGDLNAQRLGLKVTPYDPGVHYDQVRGKWYGVRTPDGR
ncbi:MAG: TolC family outer membrane protein [Alphaproteobacteria bacterium]|nr:TolC family outer membrane protein [Alphaproteobacteria bacterium]